MSVYTTKRLVLGVLGDRGGTENGAVLYFNYLANISLWNTYLRYIQMALLALQKRGGRGGRGHQRADQNGPRKGGRLQGRGPTKVDSTSGHGGGDET